jgi:hypothetical protein
MLHKSYKTRSKMVSSSTCSLLAAASIILMAAPIGVSAFSQSEAPAQASSDSAQVSGNADRASTSIVYLRLRINVDGKVTLLAKDVVDGRWQDNRNVPVGPRLYYEVLDNSGNVIASGFRRDPRYLHASRYEDFLLTAPYTANSASFNVYMVDYENGGRGGYSRDYSLLASVDVRQMMTASVQ